MGCFYFLLFIFLTQTIAGQWGPQPRCPPHAHAGAPACLAPHHPRGTQAPAAPETMTTPTPLPECPPPALIAGLTPPQLPLPRLPHPQQPQLDPHPPENI